MKPRADALPANPKWSVSPLLVGFVALFAIAEIVKYTHGDALWGTVDLVTAAILATACALTRHFTRAAVALDERPVRGRALPLQLAVCGFVVLATALDGLAFHHLAPPWMNIPLWGHTRALIYAGASRWLPWDDANGVANFTMYCVPVGLVLLALGLPLTALGLGRFKPGSGASAVAWLIIPVSVFGFALISGRATLLAILATWCSNLLQNGISEEFLWRGAVLGRLLAVMKTEYAVYAQALLFGAWHAGADLGAYHGNIVYAIADMIASQATFGLAFGYLRIRTGNIAIGTAFHLLFDSMQMFQ